MYVISNQKKIRNQDTSKDSNMQQFASYAAHLECGNLKNNYL